ncbi:hypothetical protein [Streptomyces sp. NPDC002851]
MHGSAVISDRGGRARRSAALTCVATLVAAVLLALVGPGVGVSHAASSSCEGHKIRTFRFKAGEVRLYRSSGWVCAITVAKKPGKLQVMSVTVKPRGHRAVTRTGLSTKRTQPLTVYAGHRCVKVAGSVGGSSYASRWILC